MQWFDQQLTDLMMHPIVLSNKHFTRIQVNIGFLFKLACLIGWLIFSKCMEKQRDLSMCLGYGGYGPVPTANTLQYPPIPIPYSMNPAAARFPYYSEPPMSPHHQHRATPVVAPSSPDSVPASSSSNKDISQSTSPNSVGAGPLSTPHILPSQQPLTYRQHDQQQAALVTPLSPRFSNATTERVKETIARANSVPMEFYHTEFLEYSKETYEKKKQSACKRNKRKRSAAATANEPSSSSSTTNTSEKKQKLDHISEEESTGNDDDSVVEDEDG